MTKPDRQEQIRRSESRWPPAFATVTATVLYALLPPHLTLGPRWLMPALVAALLIPLLAVGPFFQGRELSRWLRMTGVTLIGLVNAANVASLVLLVRALVTGVPKESGLGLLYSAAAIWFTNILVFALWFWEFDRGGPQVRLNAGRREADFMFPQMLSPACAPVGWLPDFMDYLYVGFTNATAFSPTDTMPLSTWAKVLMTIEALISLLTVVLVAARAVNILS